MSEVTIRTNNHVRSVLSWHDLTPKEQENFDYITESDRDTAEFGRYRGAVYDLHDMERGWGALAMPDFAKDWDNYLSDSFFSGILIRWVNGGEGVIFGRWYS